MSTAAALQCNQLKFLLENSISLDGFREGGCTWEAQMGKGRGVESKGRKEGAGAKFHLYLKCAWLCLGQRFLMGLQAGTTCHGIRSIGGRTCIETSTWKNY